MKSWILFVILFFVSGCSSMRLFPEKPMKVNGDFGESDRYIQAIVECEF